MQRALDVEPRSVAIVRLRTGLGDLLCSVPALRALRARLPGARVTMITFPEMAPVVERQRPWVDELMAFPGYPGIPERRPDVAGIGAFLAQARRRRFDLAIQMYGSRPAANELTALLGARRTAGFFMPGRRQADLRTHLPYPEHLHEIDRHLALMELLGAPSRGRELEFPLRPKDTRAAAALRARAGLDARTYAVLHPGGTSRSRRWPPERFAAVGDALAAEGLRVAVTGVGVEAPLTRAVMRTMRAEAADLSGRTILGAFAALLRDAALLVSNDTGAAHLAAALRTPSVVAFTASDPRRWAPLDAERHRVARVQVECSPCPHLVCPIDHRCAERLQVRSVLSQARELLVRAHESEHGITPIRPAPS